MSINYTAVKPGNWLPAVITDRK